MDVRRVLPEVSEEGSSLHWHPRSGQRLQEGIRVMADGGRDCGRMSPSPAGEGRSFISHWRARQLMASAAGQDKVQIQGSEGRFFEDAKSLFE